jgi:hypothetical protein
MPFTKICIRALSNSSASTGRSFLRPERVAKTTQGAFSSHMNSATAKFRNVDDRNIRDSEGSRSPAESIPDPEREIFVQGGRLKRTNAQSNSNENTVQVNRMKGRIVRTSETDENATAGGSIANQMSATARHRLNRGKNEDGVIVSNPSQLSIPVTDADASTETNPDMTMDERASYNYTTERVETSSSSSVVEEDEKVVVEKPNPPPSGGRLGKVMIFLAGTSVGIGFSAIYAVENSLY